jgi:translation initiation factor IF-1
MGKSKAARNRSAKHSNEKMTCEVMKPTSEAIFGRVERCLGFCSFEVVTSHGKRGIATLPGKFKRTIFIHTDDVVVLEDGVGEYPMQIIGIISKDDARMLRNTERITEYIYKRPTVGEKEDEEAGFEFSNDSDDDSVDVDAV